MGLVMRNRGAADRQPRFRRRPGLRRGVSRPRRHAPNPAWSRRGSIQESGRGGAEPLGHRRQATGHRSCNQGRALLRPTRDVRALGFVRNEAYAAIGAEWVALDSADAVVSARSSDAPRGADIDAVVISPDESLLALIQGGRVEVRRWGDGKRVGTDALLERRPTSLQWSADGRSLYVATQLDARPWRIPVEFAASPAAEASPSR